MVLPEAVHELVKAWYARNSDVRCTKNTGRPKLLAEIQKMKSAYTNANLSKHRPRASSKHL